MQLLAHLLLNASVRYSQIDFFFIVLMTRLQLIFVYHIQDLNRKHHKTQILMYLKLIKL
jgi:hypothetical protein